MPARSNAAYPDPEIVDGLRSGGILRKRFEYILFEKYAYLVAKQGQRKYYLSLEDAKSAYSDTIISVISDVLEGAFKGDSSLKTYVFRIFSNKCVDLLRKNTTNRDKVQRVSADQELSIPLPGALQKLINKEEVNMLMAMLDKLSEKCQKILMAWGQGYKMEEIKAMVGAKDNASTKSMKYKCLQKLKKKWKVRRYELGDI